MLKKPKRKINIKKFFATAGLAVILATVAFNFVPSRPAIVAADGSQCDVSKFTDGHVEFSKDQFSWGEGFKSYAKISVPVDQADNCLAASQSTGFTIQIKVLKDTYNGAGRTCEVSGDVAGTKQIGPENEVQPKDIMANGKLVGFEVDLDEGKFSDWYTTFYNSLSLVSKQVFTNPSSFVADCLDQEHTLSIHYKIVNQNGDSEKDIGDASTVLLGRDGPTQNPDKTISRAGVGSSSSTPWKADAIPLSIKGLRTVYRAVYNETLTIPYSIDWGDAKHPNFGENIEKPGQPLNNIYIGIKWKNSTSITCDQAECANIRINDIRKRHTSVPDSALTDADGAQIKAATLTEAVKSVDPSMATAGTPMGTNGFTVFAIFGVGEYPNGIPLRNKAADISVEIYASDASRATACEAQNKDKPDPKAFCADPKNASQAGQEQTVTSTADGGAAGGASASGCSSTPLLCFMSDVILWIVQTINAFLYFLFYYIISPIISAMLSIHTFSDTFVQVIYPGWEIMRNICNIFFILALLVIALATVFGVKGYQYKTLLLNLLIAALFVNFSLVIGQAVLGLTETIQSQFLNPGIVRQLGKSLMYDPIFQTFPTTIDSVTATGRLIRPFLYLFLAFGSFVVMAMIAWALFLRMIALWIYYMISPLAWAAGALPMTAKYRSQWWSGFLNNALFVPALAFFLNIAALLAQKQSTILETITASSFKTSTSPILTGIIFQIAGTAVIIIFLVKALEACKNFSASGSAAILKVANRGFTNPFGMTKDAYKKAKDIALKTGKNVGKYSGANWAADRVFGGTKYDPREWNRIRKENSDKKKKNRLEDRRAKAEPFIRNTMPNKNNLKRWGNILKYDARYPRNGYKTLADKAEEREERLKLLDSDDKDKLVTKSSKAADAAKEKELQIKDIRALNVEKLTGDELVSRMKDQEKDLEGKITNLNQSYMKSTDPQQRDTIKKEVDKLQETKDALAQRRADMETEISSTGRADASLKAASVDAKVGTLFRDSILKPLEDEYEGIRVAKEEEYATAEAEVKKDDDQRAKLAAKYKFNPNDRYDEKSRDADQKELDKYEAAISKTTAPVSHYDRELLNKRISEASKTLEGNEDDGELSQLMKEAYARKDKHKFLAILQKRSKNGDMDSVLKDFKHDVSFQGKQDFYKTNVQDQFKMDNKQVLQVATDNTKHDKTNKQYDLAGATKRDKGEIRWMTEKEHNDKVADMMKDDVRESIKKNKIGAYVHTVKGEKRVHPGAVEFLKAIPEDAPYLNEFNIGAAQELVKVKDWDAGLKPKVVIAIKRQAGIT